MDSEGQELGLLDKLQWARIGEMARCVAAMDRLLPTLPYVMAVSHVQGLDVRIGAPVLWWNTDLSQCIWGPKLGLGIDAFVAMTKKNNCSSFYPTFGWPCVVISGAKGDIKKQEKREKKFQNSSAVRRKPELLDCPRLWPFRHLMTHPVTTM